MPSLRHPLRVTVFLALAAISLVGVLYWQLGDGLSHQLLLWQRTFHRQLVSAITEFNSLTPTEAWWGVLSVSFAYGVFHAAGPGHGKAIIATYLTTHRQAMPRGVLMALASSLLQGVTAIAMVMVLVHGLGQVTRQAMASVVPVEVTSFTLIMLLGAWLIWRSAKHLLPDDRHKTAPGDGNACCHHHAPTPTEDWRTTGLAIFSIGLRPCTGAVLLLGAASLLGNFLTGIVAVLAMSLGTAIVVASVAVGSVVCRHWVERLATHAPPLHGISRLASWAALSGGVVIVMIGASLLVAVMAGETASPAPRLF